MRHVPLLILVWMSCNRADHFGVEDLGTDAQLSPQDGGSPCVIDDDCPAGGRVNLDGGFTVTAWVCAYKIADGCSAKGTCMQIPSTTCASFEELCGCDGQLVRAGACFYASG